MFVGSLRGRSRHWPDAGRRVVGRRPGTGWRLESGSTRGHRRTTQNDIRDAGPLRAAFHGVPAGPRVPPAPRTDVRASMSDRRTTRRSTSRLDQLGSAAAAVGVRRVVNTSTAAPSTPRSLIPPRDGGGRPLSAYGLSKPVVEEYAEGFRCSFGLDVVTLPYGNSTARARTRRHAGSSRSCERLLHRPAADSCSRRRRPATSSTSGDVARPTRRPDSPDLPHRVYNVGTAPSVDPRAAASRPPRPPARSRCGRRRPAPRRPGEVHRSCLDVRRSSPSSGLDRPVPLVEGLRHTIGWIRSR